jgi:hypothetical protein
MKVLIEVQCFNRKTITEKSLSQLKQYKKGADLLIVNDHSTEYDNEWLEQFADEVIQYPEKATINRLKYRTFKRFLDSDYDFLYMCDNDAMHDPDFMNQLFKIHYQSDGLPVTLYRSSFIKRCNVYKVIKLIPNGEVRQGLFGGISTFLSREHVQNIVNYLPPTEEQWALQTEKTAWDSQIQRWSSNNFFAVPQMSYVEHFGLNGQNHKTKTSDLALDPTPYLKKISDDIWKTLEE